MNIHRWSYCSSYVNSPQVFKQESHWCTGWHSLSAKKSVDCCQNQSTTVSCTWSSDMNVKLWWSKNVNFLWQSIWAVCMMFAQLSLLYAIWMVINSVGRTGTGIIMIWATLNGEQQMLNTGKQSGHFEGMSGGKFYVHCSHWMKTGSVSSAVMDQIDHVPCNCLYDSPAYCNPEFGTSCSPTVLVSTCMTTHCLSHRLQSEQSLLEGVIFCLMMLSFGKII
jgi:hypothetical protein